MLLPNHLAIIMDGNGRWAKMQNRPRSFGHIKGTRIAKKVITACSDKGIKFLTLYAFSTENWLRPTEEVGLLMTILKRYLRKETDNLFKKNIRFTTIGDLEKLPAELIQSIKNTEEVTRGCTGMNLVLAINYGSRQEIVSSVKKLATKVSQGLLAVDDINEEKITTHLQTGLTPDPDLIIRTSGEERLSNFLLWQAAYSEFYFCTELWPDFTIETLERALLSYSQRQRRYGGIISNDLFNH